MDILLNILNEGDACSLLCLIAILAFIGSRMVEAKPATRQWGWRFAAGSFVGYALYTGVAMQPDDVGEWLRIVLRAVLAGGLALGPSWICLSIVTFVAGALTRCRHQLSFRVRPPKPPSVVYVDRPVPVPAPRPSVTDLEEELHRQLAALETLALAPEEHKAAKDTLTMDFLRKIEKLNERAEE